MNLSPRITGLGYPGREKPGRNRNDHMGTSLCGDFCAADYDAPKKAV